MIFDAALNVRDLATQYNISLPDDPSYETIGGFVLNRLGFIPRGGESFEAEGYRFTVMEMDRRRVSRVKIKSVQPPPAAPLDDTARVNPADEKASDTASAQKSKPRAKAKHSAKARRDQHHESGKETGPEVGKDK
jgi:putative hemolysin